MKKGEAPISITPLTPVERPQWQAFLKGSANGTLFHDLDFLDYHPAGRFRFEHLLLRQKGKILALLPGGLVERPEGDVFASPLGGSVGGPVVSDSPGTAKALAMVQVLQEYARERSWAGMDITLPSVLYAGQMTETIPFALFGRGFQLVNRWLCAMLDLGSVPAPIFEHLFHKRRKTFVRASQRKGLKFCAGGVDLLAGFVQVYEDTYERHGLRATHNPEEIRALLIRHPNKTKIYLAMLEGQPTAGVMVFFVRPDIAYTFYLCSSTALAAERGLGFLLAELADLLARQGLRWLDLGPSAWDGNFNAGVTFFKESLGCLTHCRDRWSWRSSWTGGPVMAGLNFISREA